MAALPPGIDELDVPVGDFTFHALAAGPSEGRTVLLLHGFPQTSFSYRHQLTALADAGYRAVAPDQRGYSNGARPAAVEAYEIEHLVADVVAIADEIGAHQFDLVGHDWGGLVAWWVAARFPERLRTLTALATPHPAALADAYAESDDQRTRSAYVDFFRQEDSQDLLLGNDAAGLRALYAGSGMPADEIDPNVAAMSEPGRLGAALNWYRANTLDNAGLAAITVPTMYVWATGDVALGADAAHGTAKYVSGPYRFETLEGASHWMTEERPAEISALLLDFLGAPEG